MHFSFSFSYIELILTSLATVASLILIFFYRRRISAVAKAARTNNSRDIVAVDLMALPPVSIIIYDREGGTALSNLLDDLLSQKAESPFEIIVVSDGNAPTTIDVVNFYSLNRRNIHLTFVPDDAHALSRKKLAITLGVKGAKYDNVLLLESGSRIPSPLWLSTMNNHFAAGRNLVVGHAVTKSKNSSGSRHPMRLFDMLCDTVTYLSSAIQRHRPYRANAANLGFSRKLFFEHKGFADSVGLHHGVDDIFINKISKKALSAVELSEKARVELYTDDLATWHRLDKIRHRFTGKFIPGNPRRAMSLFNICMWLWLGATIASLVLSYPNIMPATICVAFGLMWIITSAISWKKDAKALGLKVSGLALPAMMLLYPIYNFIYRLRSKSYTEKNFTWSKP